MDDIVAVRPGTPVAVTEWGAIGNGEDNATGAFQALIDACVQHGGGTIVIPPGAYIVGSLRLGSRITLQLEPGAALLGSLDDSDYPLIDHRYEGVHKRMHAPQIYSIDSTDIAITGRGLIDGRAQRWWQRAREHTLTHNRPHLIGLRRCSNVLFDSVTLRNSGSWAVNPIHCTNVVIRGIILENPSNAPNTDGINPDSCSNVHISDCSIDVGDDCIAIKSGTEETPEGERRVCERITITNCTMHHGHGGVVIGSEMSGGVRDVVVSNCVFAGTERGIRIKSQRGRGGCIENVSVSNIVMRDVRCPFTINLFYHFGPRGKTPYVQDRSPQAVREDTPRVRNIRISNIIVTNAQSAAAFITGLPEMPIENLDISDVTIESTDTGKEFAPEMTQNIEKTSGAGLYLANIRGMSLKNIRLGVLRSPALTLENIDECRLDGVVISGPESILPLIKTNVRALRLRDCTCNDREVSEIVPAS